MIEGCSLAVNAFALGVIGVLPGRKFLVTYDEICGCFCLIAEVDSNSLKCSFGYFHRTNTPPSRHKQVFNKTKKFQRSLSYWNTAQNLHESSFVLGFWKYTPLGEPDLEVARSGRRKDHHEHHEHHDNQGYR